MKMSLKNLAVAAMLAALTSGSAAAMDLPAPIPEFRSPQEWQAEAASRAAASELSPADTEQLDTFYTGKPRDGDAGKFIFLFRDYIPQLARWNFADPSGFPDGANNTLFVINRPVGAVDIAGLQTGLITGLDITVRVLRSGSWVDITAGGDLYKSTDTRLELHVTNDPYSADAMLASNGPLGGYGVDAGQGGRLYPTLANQSIGAGVSGATYWAARYWPTGHTYPLVKLDGSVSGMKVGGAFDVLVLYNPNGLPSPSSWSLNGNILE